jgi:RHS repeat-associated protein
VALTDKKFTGQQEEGTSFGLYDYGARFYSTTLGRFLSADPLVVSPGDPQMLDRYSYVRNNPLIYVDPTGLTLTIVGGYLQNCEWDKDNGINMGTIQNYAYWVKFYWYMYEGVPLDVLDKKWDMFAAYIAYGASPEQQLAAGHVAFLSSAEEPGGLFNMGEYTSKVSGFLGNHPDVDTIIGFSMGGHIAATVLASGDYGNVRRAILIEKADAWLGDPLNYRNLPKNVNIVTLNHSDAHACILGGALCGDMHGETEGVVNIESRTALPQGHGNFGQNPDVVFFTLAAVSDPMGFQRFSSWSLTVQYRPVPRPVPAP